MPDFDATILQYSELSNKSGFSSAFTIFTIAFVPFKSIPIQDTSFLFNLNSFINLSVLIFVFINKLDIYYKINESIIINYDKNKRNYEIINNLNQFAQFANCLQHVLQHSTRILN